MVATGTLFITFFAFALEQTALEDVLDEGPAETGTSFEHLLEQGQLYGFASAAEEPLEQLLECKSDELVVCLIFPEMLGEHDEAVSVCLLQILVLHMADQHCLHLCQEHLALGASLALGGLIFLRRLLSNKSQDCLDPVKENGVLILMCLSERFEQTLNQ